MRALPIYVIPVTEKPTSKHFDQEQSIYGMDNDKKPETNIKGGKDEDPTLRDTVENWAGNTTSHGWPHILVGKGIIIKLFWFVLTCAAIYFLAYLMIGIVNAFTSNAVTTSMEVRRSNFMYFPAITFCNINMVRQYKTGLNDKDKLGAKGSNELPGVTAAGELVARRLAAEKRIVCGLAGKVSVPAIGVTVPVGGVTVPEGEVTGPEGGVTVNGGGATVASGVTLPADVTTAAPPLAVPGTTVPAATVITTPPVLPGRKKRQLNTLLTTGSTKDRVEDLYTAPPTVQPPAEMIVNEEEKQLIRLQEEMDAYSFLQRKEFGHQLCDMVLKCEYSQSKCDMRNFEWKWNADHGNCFTFNQGDLKDALRREETTKTSLWSNLISVSEIETSNRPGPKTGLDLIFNLEPDEYVQFLGHEVGIKIVIHNQTRMPFPEEEGVVISPGSSTNISIKRKEITRLGQESSILGERNFSNCFRAEKDSAKVNMYQELYQKEYSQSACLITCYQKHVIKKCQCFDSGYPAKGANSLGDKTYIRSLEPCSYDLDSLNYTQETSQWYCKETTKRAYVKNELDCDCPSTCSDTNYEINISQSAWPAVKVQPLCQKLAKIAYIRLTSLGNSSKCYQDFDADGINLSSWTKEYEQLIANETAAGELEGKFIDIICASKSRPMVANLAQVRIYYSEFNFESISQSPKVVFVDLISNIGGVFGLCLGFSVFTFFEYVQIIIELIYVGTLKVVRVLQKKDSVTPE